MKLRLTDQESTYINEWDHGIIPIFPNETRSAEQAGFTETDESCLCWVNGDFKIVRKTINGPGSIDMLRYFSYLRIGEDYTLVDKPARQFRMVKNEESGEMEEQAFIPDHPGHLTINDAIAVCK